MARSRTVRLSFVALLVLLAAAPAEAIAKPGDLDRRFGKRGLLLSTRLEGGMAAQVDGRGHVLVAGGSYVPGVARIGTRGRLDRRFGTKGIARNRRVGALIPFDLRRRRDGTVLVAGGSAFIDAPPASLLRFSRRGRPAGSVVHRDAIAGPIAGVALRSDGGAYLAGVNWAISSQVRSIAPDGTTDQRFAGGTVVPCPPPSFCQVSAIAVDGPWVVIAYGNARSTVASITPDGAITVLAKLRHRVDALDQRPDGSVLAAGPDPFEYDRRRHRLARVSIVLGTGGVAREFGRRGTAVAGLLGRGTGGVTDVAGDRSGRIYVLANRGRRPIVARLTRRGRPDRRFSRDGSAAAPAPRNRYDTYEGRALVLDRRRGVIVAGKLLRGGSYEPIFCGIREDLCASAVRLGVWRFRR